MKLARDERRENRIEKQAYKRNREPSGGVGDPRRGVDQVVDVAVRRGQKEERHVQKRQRVSTVRKKEEERDRGGGKSATCSCSIGVSERESSHRNSTRVRKGAP